MNGKTGRVLYTKKVCETISELRDRNRKIITKNKFLKPILKSCCFFFFALSKGVDQCVI